MKEKHPRRILHLAMFWLGWSHLPYQFTEIKNGIVIVGFQWTEAVLEIEMEPFPPENSYRGSWLSEQNPGDPDRKQRMGNSSKNHQSCSLLPWSIFTGHSHPEQSLPFARSTQKAPVGDTGNSRSVSQSSSWFFCTLAA